MNRSRAVVATARAMSERGLVVGTAGNVSVRTTDGLLITPTRADYGTLRPRHLVTVLFDATITGGSPQASRELPLHVAIYRARPNVGAVVHTHSPYATAWSFRAEPLAPRTEDMDYAGMGRVGCAPAHPPGSLALAAAVAAALGDARAALLGDHGVVAVGATPAEALTAAEVVEHQAQIAWIHASGRAAFRPTHPNRRSRRPKENHRV